MFLQLQMFCSFCFLSWFPPFLTVYVLLRFALIIAFLLLFIYCGDVVIAAFIIHLWISDRSLRLRSKQRPTVMTSRSIILGVMSKGIFDQADISTSRCHITPHVQSSHLKPLHLYKPFLLVCMSDPQGFGPEGFYREGLDLRVWIVRVWTWGFGSWGFGSWGFGPCPSLCEGPLTLEKDGP